MAEKSPRSLLGYLHQVVGPTASDRELLDQFVAARDEAAFAALVRRHGPTVWGVCRRVLGHAQDAEDAYQATFVVLARQAGRLRQPYAVGAWLYGVARRVALKLRARNAGRRDLPAEPATTADPLATLSGRELLEILDAELLALPAEYRAPLLLCCLEGKSRDEAAEQLGVSAGALKGRLERGRQLLAQRLARRGVTLSAALATLLVWQSAASATPPAVTAAGLLAGASASAVALADAVAAGAVAGPIRLAAVALVVALAGVGGALLWRGNAEVAEPAGPAAVAPVVAPAEPVAPPPAPGPAVGPLTGDVLAVGPATFQFRPRPAGGDQAEAGPSRPVREVALAPETRLTRNGVAAAPSDLRKGVAVVVTFAPDDRTAVAVEVLARKAGRPEGAEAKPPARPGG